MLNARRQLRLQTVQHSWLCCCSFSYKILSVRSVAFLSPCNLIPFHRKELQFNRSSDGLTLKTLAAVPSTAQSWQNTSFLVFLDAL
jgi:hypothetical protein